MNKIGTIIKSTRKARGLTQRAFGETLTVSQSYISSVESGKETPTPMFIKQMCIRDRSRGGNTGSPVCPDEYHYAVSL